MKISIDIQYYPYSIQGEKNIEANMRQRWGGCNAAGANAGPHWQAEVCSTGVGRG
jgi:hypothetical protein